MHRIRKVDIAWERSPILLSLESEAEGQVMVNNLRLRIELLVGLLLLAFIPSNGGTQDKTQNPSEDQKQQMKGGVVYVCACLKTKSCSCMTEAKTEGPCACGTEGGPPLKAVPRDSAWAKENREALAK